MGFWRIAGQYLLWLFVFVLFLDHQRPWRAPWNWRPGDSFADVACADEAGRAAESNVTSGLKVVLPSVGQTGTTSLFVALETLGLRTYHIEEQLIFTRPAMSKDATAETWARHFSRCRVDAVALEPAVDRLPVVLQSSPGAKFIMTWRDFPSWQRSTSAGGAKDVVWHLSMSVLLSSSLRMLPWLNLWDAATGRIHELILAGRPFAAPGRASLLDMLCFYSFFVLSYGDFDNRMLGRGTNKVSSLVTTMEASEEAYIAHMDEIRRLVPEDRLLIFDVRKHGWAELCGFLGLPEPPAGTPVPHPRSKDSFTNDTLWDYATNGQRVALLCILVVTHIINFAVVKACFRLLRGFWATVGKAKTA